LNLGFLCVTRSRKSFSELNKGEAGKVYVFCPISKSNILYAIQDFFIKFRDFDYPDIDTLVFDSDPYSILVHRTIIKKLRPRRIIYRQSDPMFIVASNSLVAKAEKELMEKSDYVAVVNNWIFERVVDLNLAKRVVELPNPIKLNKIEISGRFEIPGFESYLVYYGKYDIDYNLINKIAALNPTCCFVIFGDYEADRLSGKNIIFKGFKSLDCIMGWLENSSGLFIPYLNKGHSEMLGVTSKILMAQKLSKPVIATAVSSSLSKYNIVVCDDINSFSDAIANVHCLRRPSVPVEKFSEANVCSLMKKLILDEY
jgi:hypothetical protein